MLSAALNAASVAVIGASDNPHKVGGRPVLYLQRYGFRGRVYPVNAARATVQGLPAYPHIGAIAEAPELAVVAVSGEEALRAVEACAERGVKVCVVLASGFGETGAAGREAQDRMAARARASGMRLIGPNCQGVANFGTGLVANFSTIFHELEGRDGPVAIVSQSGANAQAIYALLREKGLAARHVHATGNEADVTAAELAAAVAADPGVRLLLLYLEAIKDPPMLARAAAVARERGVPIVALKAGRTPSGWKAAASHTGALATEDTVIDAFFERHGIWRADDPASLVSAAELYLGGRRPRGRRLVFISNSGASCVMAADYAEERSVPLAQVSADAKRKLAAVLPAFAAMDNPVDVTGALLGNAELFGAVLPIVGGDVHCDLLVAAFPVAGAGYDLPRLAQDLAGFQSRYPAAAAVAAPQASVREPFRKAGTATFSSEREAIDALVQLADHAALLRKPAPPAPKPAMRHAASHFLNEAESLAMLEQAGLPVVEHRLCGDAQAVRAAVSELGPAVVLKACSPDVPHKSEHGLIALEPHDAAAEFERQRSRCLALGARFQGVIVARRLSGVRELALGARVDPRFGPLVLVGDGGVHLEALRDFRLLVPPFDEAEVREKLAALRVAPLLRALRGRPAPDVEAFARMAVQLASATATWEGRVISVDINPVLLFETGAVALDALLEVSALESRRGD